MQSGDSRVDDRLAAHAGRIGNCKRPLQFKTGHILRRGTSAALSFLPCSSCGRRMERPAEVVKDGEAIAEIQNGENVFGTVKNDDGTPVQEVVKKGWLVTFWSSPRVASSPAGVSGECIGSLFTRSIEPTEPTRSGTTCEAP
jgi:hypothetical protein